MNQRKDGGDRCGLGLLSMMGPFPLVLLGQVASGRRGLVGLGRYPRDGRHRLLPPLLVSSSSIPRRKWQRLPPRFANKQKQSSGVEGQRKQPHAILGDAAPPTYLSEPEPRAGHSSNIVRQSSQPALQFNFTFLLLSARPAPPISGIYPRCRSSSPSSCYWVGPSVLVLGLPDYCQSPLYRPAGGVVRFLICII